MDMLKNMRVMAGFSQAVNALNVVITIIKVLAGVFFLLQTLTLLAGLQRSGKPLFHKS